MIQYTIIILMALLWGASIYFLLRPKGLVESVMENRERRIVVLEAQVQDILGRLGVVAAEMAENTSYAQHNVSQLRNRLTSLETRIGKQNAKQSKEEVQQEFFQFVDQNKQQLKLGG